MLYLKYVQSTGQSEQKSLLVSLLFFSPSLQHPFQLESLDDQKNLANEALVSSLSTWQQSIFSCRMKIHLYYISLKGHV